MISSIFTTTTNNQQVIVPYFAQAFNNGQYAEDVYGANVYNSQEYGGSTSGGNTDGLIDTGTALIFTITVGSILVFGAIIAKIWRRPSSKPNQNN